VIPGGVAGTVRLPRRPDRFRDLRDNAVRWATRKSILREAVPRMSADDVVASFHGLGLGRHVHDRAQPTGVRQPVEGDEKAWHSGSPVMFWCDFAGARLGGACEEQ
jgi:hypothetical protein